MYNPMDRGVHIGELSDKGLAHRVYITIAAINCYAANDNQPQVLLLNDIDYFAELLRGT